MDILASPCPENTLPTEWYTSQSPVDYETAIAIMEQRIHDIREHGKSDYIWLLEHPPLYTAGTSAQPQDLLDAERFPLYQTGRGGQFTYHGPGQRIAYLMLDLKRRAQPQSPDLRRYVQTLEAWVIDTLGVLGVKSFIREGRIGVWTVTPSGKESKIAAIGIRVRKWVSYHGISLNVHPDLSHYSGIVPCGIQEYGVTSLKDMGIDASMAEVDAALQEHFHRHFP